MDHLIAKDSECILFIDDEAYLAEIGKEMLEDYGYVVEPATRPKEALALFEKNPDQFDLVITDYTMPGMNGGQLAEEIRRINPDIPIIMCTGVFLDPDLTSNLQLEKVLMKPIEMEDMLAVIRDVLDSVSG